MKPLHLPVAPLGPWPMLQTARRSPVFGRLIRGLAVAATCTAGGATASAAESYYFAGFAGDPTHGGSADFRNGSQSARFDLPSGVAVDDAGIVYVADTGNNVIRRISVSGAVSTFAGSPSESGSADGSATNARFNAPAAIAIDGSGNLYVADTGNHIVRKVATDGSVSTVAGAKGVAGFANGDGANARFSGLRGIAALPDGTLFVADTGNHVIRAITTSGTVTTVAGTAHAPGFADGLGAAARFAGPAGVAIDPNGDLYVADTLNHTIRKIAINGDVTTVAGLAREPGTANDTGVDARFDEPVGIAVSSAGVVYVADSINHAIRAIATNGDVTTGYGRIGTPGDTDGSPTAARFRGPQALAFGSSGDLYVADSLNNTIRLVTVSDNRASTLAGSAPSSATNDDGDGRDAEFSRPSQLAIDASGTLFTTDSLAHTIRMISPAGNVLTYGGAPGEAGANDGIRTVATFRRPTGVALGLGGELYISDTGNHTIRVLTPDGFVDTHAGRENFYGTTNGARTAARFLSPTGLVVDVDGNLYIADTGNHVIRRITPDGTTSTYAGQVREPGDNDGSRTSAHFFAPTALAFAAGDLYVADTGNHTIRRISAAGTVSTIAGRAGVPGSVDGIATGPARLDSPDGIVVAADGTIFFADRGTHLVRMIANALVNTIAGLDDRPGFEGGEEIAARFRRPAGLALDRAGAIYVADADNDTIRRGVRLAGTAGRLTNISVRSTAGTGGATLIVGFFIEGGGAKEVLLRGIGPGLTQYNVPGVLADPQLRLYAAGSNVPLQENDNWGGGAALANAFVTAGAFPLPGNSLDAALLAPLGAAGYTAHVTSTGNPGIALLEGYDIDAAPTADFVNVSARANVTLGDGVLIAGFAISGGPATVLIRGIGPTLESQGVTGTLTNPNLAVFDSGSVRISANADWSEGLNDAFTRVGAFSLPGSSRDAAILVTLQPGTYTTHVSGTGAESGIGLVEVYLVR